MKLLTEEDEEKIKKWIMKKAPNLKCFCCGYAKWRLGESAAMTIMIDTNSGRIHYMEGYPMIGLICQNCAHIEWFSAILMGLKPKVVTE
jgi:hypothetical protein